MSPNSKLAPDGPLSVVRSPNSVEQDNVSQSTCLLNHVARDPDRMHIPASVSLDFANEQWQRVVMLHQGKRKKKKLLIACRAYFCHPPSLHLTHRPKGSERVTRGKVERSIYRTGGAIGLSTPSNSILTVLAVPFLGSIHRYPKA